MNLHVACLPFPSHQGTQAAIDAMLRAAAATREPSHLLTYAHGAHPLDAPYEVHRIPDLPRVRSLRSGPSLGKIALDLRCIAATRALVRRLRPSAIVAHHVEAAAACLAARVGPVYYVAHTSLGLELPVYFPRLTSRGVAAIASMVERKICTRATGVAAIAPSLARLLVNEAHYLPVPWRAPADTGRPSKRAARHALRLPEDAPIGLYAGNLDRYQGWEHLFEATARLRCIRRGARLLVATESATAPARRLANRLGIDSAVDFRNLGSERARALAHAACDVAWVPRRTEGGLPIKMLDAFARGVPVIAMERATAGLPVRSVCRVVENDSPEALAAATAELLATPVEASALCRLASQYLATHHSDAAHVRAMQRWLCEADATRPTAKPPARRPPTERALQAR
jgi:glycosyltransferase involved in cell wall biosynthesis